MSSIPFVDRNPTDSEIERIRLILSTFQDGTGMLDGGRRPGWRDFERAVALALGGEAQESKFIFDVLLSDASQPGIKYGLSCKMGNQLDRIEKRDHAFMELSNSAKKFWDYLQSKGLYQSNYKEYPVETGTALLELVHQWHIRESLARGGVIDITKSSYLVLSYNKAGRYQLHQFPLDFPQNLRWYFSTDAEGSATRNLRAEDGTGLIFEWYGESGGQLKYYPPITLAIWASQKFQLEPLPESAGDSLLAKVKAYFPEKWEAASDK